MYPFNFITACISLGVTFFYVAVNRRSSSHSGEGYLQYRAAFCFAVIFLGLVQIVRAFSPLELQSYLLQIGVATVIVILIFGIKTFELIAGHQPGWLAKALIAGLIFATLGTLFLPGGGYSLPVSGHGVLVERSLLGQTSFR